MDVGNKKHVKTQNVNVESNKGTFKQETTFFDLSGMYQSLESKIRHKDTSFTGFGLIVSLNPISKEILPLTPLVNNDATIQINSLNLINSLWELSSIHDVRHDGFHVFYPHQSVLKVAQYVAPALPNDGFSLTYNVGARIRTAQLASMYEGIQEVLCVNANKQTVIAKVGQLQELYL